jgi:DMSO/TMAO reductase YedYZ molybdopterin-dependent catalytic subunit
VVKPALALSGAELAAMPRVSARVKNREGQDRVYEGVPLAELLKRAGQPLGEDLRGSLLSKYVLVVARDGYRVLFSLPEVDPAFTEGRIIVADRVDGKPLPDREGPLRLVIPSEKREARWIRMIEKIEIAATPLPVR